MNTSANEQLDRSRGCMIGLAIGDALGVPLQGMERDWLKPVRDMLGGGLDNASPGDWSEPTSLALAMGLTLIEDKIFQASSIMRAFSAWKNKHEFCPSGKAISAWHATVESIESFDKTGSFLHPNTTALDASAVARTAPVAILFQESQVDCAIYAGRACSLTHGNPIPVELSRHLALALRHAIIGRGKDITLARFDLLSSKAGQWRNLNRDKIKPLVLAVDVFKAALWAVDVTNSFEEAVILAVNLAGDASVTGAIAGQLAGAIYGYEAIPSRWLDQLAWADVILDTANGLYGATE